MADASRTDRGSDEGEESTGSVDNSLGRLLTLADGVFAIAMTLLALDLKVPDLGADATDAALRHALRHDASSYLFFLVSFYVVAKYWQRHRWLMRAVVRTHPRLFRDTFFLLFTIVAMPFLTDLLGQYGSTPFALALYGAVNALASVALLTLRHDVQLYELMDRPGKIDRDAAHWRQSLRNLIVFLLCIPAGYLFKDKGPWVLVLLAVPLELSWPFSWRIPWPRKFKH